MKKYETFDLWAADQKPGFKKLIAAARRFVKKVSPKLVEGVKWGNGVWLGKEWPVAYLYADKDHLQFGFFGGADLSDPQGLLIGKGKHVRHVKLYSPEDIDAAQLGRWIRQATRNERR